MFKAFLYCRKIFLRNAGVWILLLLPGILVLQYGCSLFTEQEDAGESLRKELDFSTLYAERISLEREKRIMEEKRIVFCTERGFPSSWIASLEQELFKEGIHLQKMLPAEKTELISFLRSGKADLIAGRFSPESLRNRRLDPVRIFSGEKEGVADCLVIRAEGKFLKDLLNKIPLTPLNNMQKRPSSHANRKKPFPSGPVREKR